MRDGGRPPPSSVYPAVYARPQPDSNKPDGTRLFRPAQPSSPMDDPIWFLGRAGLGLCPAPVMNSCPARLRRAHLHKVNAAQPKCQTMYSDPVQFKALRRSPIPAAAHPPNNGNRETTDPAPSPTRPKVTLTSPAWDSYDGRQLFPAGLAHGWPFGCLRPAERRIIGRPSGLVRHPASPTTLPGHPAEAQAALASRAKGYQPS